MRFDSPQLTVYVSKTNKGHTRPTAATAEARSKKIFGNSSGCLLLFLAHYFVKFFNCEKFKTFSSCISLLAKLELFFVVFRLAKKRFLCSYHLRRCRAICAQYKMWENSDVACFFFVSFLFSTLSHKLIFFRKSLIQHCERSELRLHFLSKQKFNKNAKNIQFSEFSKTVLPGRSVLIGKNWWKMHEFKNSKYDIFEYFSNNVVQYEFSQRKGEKICLFYNLHNSTLSRRNSLFGRHKVGPFLFLYCVMKQSLNFCSCYIQKVLELSSTQKKDCSLQYKFQREFRNEAFDSCPLVVVVESSWL